MSKKRTKAKLRKFPKVIYVAHKPERTDGTGPTFLAVAAAAAELAELGEIIQVGKYELVEHALVSGMPRVLTEKDLDYGGRP